MAASPRSRLALAASAGISDRMLMYYFETKEDLIAQALLLLADGMAAALDDLIPKGRASAAQIIAASTREAEQSDLQRGTLMLWFEIIGRSIRGDEPYRSAANQILCNYEQWIADKLPPSQKSRARDVLAQIEGQLMLQLLTKKP